MVRQHHEDSGGEDSHLFSTRVGDVCVVILFLSRNAVCLGHHL